MGDCSRLTEGLKRKRREEEMRKTKMLLVRLFFFKRLKRKKRQINRTTMGESARTFSVYGPALPEEAIFVFFIQKRPSIKS